jgi:fructose/tagatose bisphosphate aldolase
MIAGLREFLLKNPEVIGPREYLGTCRGEIVKLISCKMREFGSADKL